MSAEIDCVSAVFSLFENMGNCLIAPTVQLGILMTIIPALRQCVGSWRGDALFR